MERLRDHGKFLAFVLIPRTPNSGIQNELIAHANRFNHYLLSIRNYLSFIVNFDMIQVSSKTPIGGVMVHRNASISNETISREQTIAKLRKLARICK